MSDVIKPSSPVKFAVIATILALIGIADAVYLTVHHYTGEKVPCGLTGGCEMVLSSAYATIYDIPLAFFGAIAYFVAFSLALLTAFGNFKLWNLFGIQVTLMACFSAWLIYVQAYQIQEFCQYCLVSAGVCFSLFVTFLASKILQKHARK
jgi:uncharacterized membrane protein